MAICLEAFVLTFWQRGDRTQIATITLAAKNPVGVTTGAILGHAICAMINLRANAGGGICPSARSLSLGGAFSSSVSLLA